MEFLYTYLNIVKFVKKNFTNKITIFIAFLVIYALLIYIYPPNLILSNTTTSGGDMCSHNYLAKFFINDLLPHFKLTGWTMDWYTGMPMFTFYFPFPYILIALFNNFIPYNISFKIITVIGPFLMPVAAYIFVKFLNFKFPYPILASLGVTLFLFMKSFSIYGGNLLSTLAGEFSFSISLAFSLIFLGTLYKGAEREKIDWLFAINCLILAMIILSHLITVIALLLIIPSFFIIKKNSRSLLYILLVFLIGFLVTSFWTIPFISNTHWITPMKWENIKNFNDLIPKELIPAAIFAFLGLIFAILKKEKNTIPFIWTVVIFSIIFFSYKEGRLWNARLLPFIYIFIYLLAAYGLYQLIFYIFSLFNKFKIRKITCNILKCTLISIIAISIGIAIIINEPLARTWSNYNYSGYESKPKWNQYKEIMEYLNTLPSGRVMYEYDDKLIEEFGSTRSFELIPFWTNKPATEGLLVESAFSATFHFINQAELCHDPGGAIPGLELPNRDISKAIEHLKFMDIRYLIVSSPDTIEYLKKDSKLKFLKSIGNYYFFEFYGNYNYIELIKEQPVRYKTKNWLTDITTWYLNVNNLKVPVVYDNNDKILKSFKEIKKSDLGNVFSKPLITNGSISEVKIENEKITFNTTAIGYPHLIKISYFPKWKAIGAYGPYLVSPTFMLVIPYQNKVTLIYCKNFYDILGEILTLLGFIIIIIILLFKKYFNIWF